MTAYRHMTQARIKRNLDLMVAAAVAGERCPMTAPHGSIDSGAIQHLVDAGEVRSEVYAHNWRVVTILKGEHRGATTAAYPGGGAPYRVNGRYTDQETKRMHGSRKIAP